jgi:hypothetical protein
VPNQFSDNQGTSQTTTPYYLDPYELQQPLLKRAATTHSETTYCNHKIVAHRYKPSDNLNNYKKLNYTVAKDAGIAGDGAPWTSNTAPLRM